MTDDDSTVLIGGVVGVGALLLLCICYCVMSQREAHKEEVEVMSARSAGPPAAAVAPVEDANEEAEEGKDDGEAEEAGGEEGDNDDDDDDSESSEDGDDEEDESASAAVATPEITHLPGGKMKKERTKGGKETSARIEKRTEAKKMKRKDLVDGPGRFSLRGEKKAAPPAVAESPEENPAYETNTQSV